jgi:hypothetical protein
MYFQLENGRLYCWQWDTHQRIVVDEFKLDLQMPFFLIGNNKSKDGLFKVKIAVEGDTHYVLIPDEVLQKDGHADVYLYDETTGTTILAWRFTIKKKAKPMDYIYEETDKITLQEILDKVNDIEMGATGP